MCLARIQKYRWGRWIQSNHNPKAWKYLFAFLSPSVSVSLRERVCLYVLKRVCAVYCDCVYFQVCLYKYTCSYVCLCICLSVCIYDFTCVCLLMNICPCVSLHMYEYMRVFVIVCVCACVCTCVRMSPPSLSFSLSLSLSLDACMCAFHLREDRLRLMTGVCQDAGIFAVPNVSTLQIKLILMVVILKVFPISSKHKKVGMFLSIAIDDYDRVLNGEHRSLPHSHRHLWP